MLRIFGKHKESDLVLRCRQVMSCLSILLCGLYCGITLGYSAVLLPQLRSNTTEDERFRDLSSGDASWIASSVIIGMLAGCMCSGYIYEMIGRKWSLFIVYSVNIVGWLVISLADGSVSLIIGRLVCGLAIGLGSPLVSVYISELSDPVLRGILLSVMCVAIAFGILLIHVIGLLIQWNTASYINIALSAISWLIWLVTPESPTWLLNKGDTDRAIEVWVYLRGCKSLDEYLALENSVVAARKFDEQSTLSDLKEALTSRHFLYPLGIVCANFFLTVFNGSIAVIFYSVDIFTEMTGSDYADLGTVISDLMRVVFTILACYLIKLWNRRTMTFVSGFGTASVYFLLTLVLYYEFGRPWLPGSLLVIAIMFTTILEPISWALCGEMFPRKFKGLGSSLSCTFQYISVFASVNSLPAMMDALNPYGSCAVYGVITLSGTILMYFTLPETKDKTLQDVERSFDRKVFRRNTVDTQFSGTLHF